MATRTLERCSLSNVRFGNTHMSGVRQCWRYVATCILCCVGTFLFPYLCWTHSLYHKYTSKYNKPGEHLEDARRMHMHFVHCTECSDDFRNRFWFLYCALLLMQRSSLYVPLFTYFAFCRKYFLGRVVRKNCWLYLLQIISAKKLLCCKFRQLKLFLFYFIAFNALQGQFTFKKIFLLSFMTRQESTLVRYTQWWIREEEIGPLPRVIKCENINITTF